MKKNLLIALLYVVISCVFVTACSNATATDLSNISVLEIGSAIDASDGGTHASEYDFWSAANCNPHNDTAAAQKMEVTFNGNVFHGDYWYSLVESYNLHPSDYYSFLGGWFSINRNSGQLETIILMDFGTGNKSVEDCRQYAEDIASQYIDLSQYSLVSSAGDPVHGYQFTKMVNGIETSDRLSVAISSSGDISSFCNFTNDDFNNINKMGSAEEKKNFIKKIASPDISKKIEEKLNSIYDNWDSYETINKKLVALENQEVGMVYTIDVNFEPVSLDDGTFYMPTSRIELLICETPTE